FMPLTVGGGVRTVDDVRALLKAGADKVSINTAAVARPEFVHEAAERFGTQCVVVAIDARRRAADDPARGWEVFTHGGRTPTGLDAVEWAARVEAAGAGEILLTSMDRDGTRAGYDLELTRAVVDRVGIPVIASGGAGTLEHLYDGLITAGAGAALVASIFHYGEHSVHDAKAYLGELLAVGFLTSVLWMVASIVLAPFRFLAIVFGLAVLVFFNAVPELVYLGRHSAAELLVESYRFIGENWIEWFPATLALGAAVIVVAALPGGPFDILGDAAA